MRHCRRHLRCRVQYNNLCIGCLRVDVGIHISFDRTKRESKSSRDPRRGDGVLYVHSRVLAIENEFRWASLQTVLGETRPLWQTDGAAVIHRNRTFALNLRERRGFGHICLTKGARRSGKVQGTRRLRT